MFFDWFDDDSPDKPPIHSLKLENFEALVVSPDTKEVALIDTTGYPMDIQYPHYAIGSGCEVAFGAMEAGASAEEAVKIAIKRVVGCGGKVMKLKL